MAAKNGVGPMIVVTILAGADEFENMIMKGDDLLNHERRIFCVVVAGPKAACPSCYL